MNTRLIMLTLLYVISMESLSAAVVAEHTSLLSNVPSGEGGEETAEFAG